MTSVYPKLTFDFTAANLDPRITFTRALDTATRVNSLGLIESVNANVARFDYNPLTLVCKGLLVENTSSNLCPYSQDMSTGWSMSSTTFALNLTDAAPDGTLTAYDIQSSATTGRAFIAVSSFTDNGTKTISMFFRKGTSNTFRFAIRNSTTNAYVGRVLVDLSGTSPSASIDIGTGTVFPIQQFTNNWYRLSASIDNVIAANTNQIWILPSAGSANTTLTVWGIQAENAAFPTSYIPTTATALTRNADVATITGTNFSDWWQAGRGGATVAAIPSTVSGTRPLIQFDDGTANKIIALQGNTTNPELYIVDGGTPQAQIDAGTIAANTAYSLTGWWQTNFCAARQGSGARVEDLTATIPTVTQARLGSDGTNYLNGHLATINYYDQFSGQIYARRKNKAVFSVL